MAARDEVLGGRYRLVDRVGEGGMGVVFRARDEASGHDVAVKLLHKTLVGDGPSIARFRHEARANAELRHENVCRVVDVGEHDGAPFLVMELLEGESLAERLSRRGRLASREAADVMLQVLAGLEAAHAAGILHRDLKPENVFLARQGDREVARVLDFGVAKFIGDDAERVKLTRTGALVGTPAYMSPEQACGRDDVDVRADVWSAGVVLYELLAGCLPYDAGNYNAMLVRIATEPVRPVEDAAPGIEPALARILSRALARSRDERFATAGEFARHLRAWLAGAPLPLARPGGRTPMPTPRVGTTPMSWAEGDGVGTQDTLPGTASRRRWTPVLLAAVLGAAGVFALHALSGKGAPGTPLASHAPAGHPPANAPATAHASAPTGAAATPPAPPATGAASNATTGPVAPPQAPPAPPSTVADARAPTATTLATTPHAGGARNNHRRGGSHGARGAHGTPALETGIGQHPDF